MLEKLGQLDPAVKGVAELMAVAEVSYAAVSRSCTCLSRENRNPDWYKILKVGLLVVLLKQYVCNYLGSRRHLRCKLFNVVTRI